MKNVIKKKYYIGKVNIYIYIYTLKDERDNGKNI